MRNSLKIFFSSLIAMMIISCFSREGAFANNSIQVMLYGDSLPLTHSPIIKNNAVLVPFKDIFSALGFTVSFDPTAKSITGVNKNTDTNIKLLVNQKTAWINNKVYPLQSAPEITNGVTYVPIRFIGEAGNLQVKWYSGPKIVSLYAKDNLFPVSSGGKFGYINSQGKIIINYQSKFSDAYRFNEGLAIVYSGGKFAGFINQQGKLVIPKDNYYDSKAFSEGLAAYRTLTTVSKYGYMDMTGASIIPPQYKKANPFSEGLAAVQIGEKYGYIDTKGKIVIKALYDSATDFSEGLALVSLKGKYLYLNKKGTVIISANYSNADLFHSGLAAVQKESKFGFIDKKGQLVIPAKYDAVHSFSEGLAAVKMDGKVGYIDARGKQIIHNTFEAAGDFHEGLAIAESQGKSGFINKAGQWVIQPTLSWAEPFYHELSYAYTNDSEVYINQLGQIVWSQK
ncbi:WG repeat-containing protein [Paenibacillus typhae]|uniref:WG containing repeat-containing protein n=1 Tax=Paenibacillus typhae TaxID=1174501 RepID=A0A1G8URT9_9BACL|nr:WG repeat-containing protein [Paenibacillus typhae]SDJ56518.1 WG containing repeat-containing protein [Paenibacillus typhae]